MSGTTASSAEPCRVCGNPVSERAAACPKCGDPTAERYGNAPARPQRWGVGKLLLLAFVGYFVYACTRGAGEYEAAVTKGVAPNSAIPISPQCHTGLIDVKSINAQFVDKCRASSCVYLEGAATIVNGCSIATGVQFKVTARDGAGVAIATKEFWPASVSNIPPGEYVVDLNQAVDHQPGMESIELTPINVRQW